MADIYVNNTFETSNKTDSSIVGIDLPLKVAGLDMQKELAFFSTLLETPRKPYTAILGGPKIPKQLIMNLLDRVDDLIIGGGMSFTFNKILNGTDIGYTLFDKEGAEAIPDIMKKAQFNKVNLHFPTDFVQGDRFAANANTSNRLIS